MTRIAVIGGTGYAGRHIIAKAVRRGHEVVSVSRTAPADPRDGVQDVRASIADIPGLLKSIGETDVIVWAISPRGDTAAIALDAANELIAALKGTSTRIGVVGGAGGSLS